YVWFSCSLSHLFCVVVRISPLIRWPNLLCHYTSLDLQAGLEARVRENITLGVQAGYAHSVSGSSAEGYNGQATLNVTF
ncbi:hypothetical protein, partial [Escherichia coli]